MKEKINLVLKLLKQLSNKNDPHQILKLEEKIQNISVDIKKEISESTEVENHKELEEKVYLLGELLNSLEKSKTANNKIFIEFQDFIKNRKFK